MYWSIRGRGQEQEQEQLLEPLQELESVLVYSSLVAGSYDECRSGPKPGTKASN